MLANPTGSSQADRQVRVLFVMSHPVISPVISVHLDLIRCFDPARVEAHVAYNRLAAKPSFTSSAPSLKAALDAAPVAGLREVDFGPLRRTARRAQAESALRASGDIARTAAYVRTHRIDLIHCEEGTHTGFYGLLLARMTGVKCVMSFQMRYGDWMSRPSSYATHHVDAIITPSDWTAGTLTDGGVPAERIVTVHNGIDASKFDPDGTDGAGVRAEFGIDPGAPVVAMVAQLVEWKRQHVLIEAFREVADRHRGARLLLVGQSHLASTDDYPERLRRLVSDLELTDSVIFLGQRRDTPEILAATDVFALPSVGEPWGLAVTEAMAMATPVVAVRAGGHPEQIVDGVDGLLSEPDDPVALADNIVALLDDPARRADMGRRGRERVLAQLNRRRMTTEVEAVYRALLGLGTPGPQTVPAAI